MAGDGGGRDDGVDGEQQLVPLLLGEGLDDELAELLLVQHALVLPVRVVFLHGLVRQVHEPVVRVDVEFQRRQPHLEALLYPRHKWR